MLSPPTSQSSKPNNTYIGCALILCTPQFEANKRSHLVCHYCKRAYKIISLPTHFNKFPAQLEKRCLDPMELRQMSNEDQKKY